MRAALVSGADIAPALQDLYERYPSFWASLFEVGVRRKFPPGSDIRKITAFTSRITADRTAHQTPFPARQAELIMRPVIDEPYLLTEINPDEMAGLTPDEAVPGIHNTIVKHLFDQAQLSEDDISELLRETASTAAQLREVAPDAMPEVERWLSGTWLAAGCERAEHTCGRTRHAGAWL